MIHTKKNIVAAAVLSLTLLLVVCTTSVLSFLSPSSKRVVVVVVSGSQPNQRQRQLQLHNNKHNVVLQMSFETNHDYNIVSRRFFGIASATSFFTLFHKNDEVSAMSNNDIIVGSLSSSTITIAQQIKELDMSMPSYNDIKNSKASVENVKSLSVPLKTTTGGSSSSTSSSEGLQKTKSSNGSPPQSVEKQKKNRSNTNLGSQGYEF